MRTTSIGTVFVIIWLIIGAVASWQRGYITTEPTCATVSSTVITIVAGPLNYIGVNPEIDCPELETPQPSE